MNPTSPEIPATLEQTPPRAVRRLHGEVPYAILRVELDAQGADAAPAVRPIAGEVSLGGSVLVQPSIEAVGDRVSESDLVPRRIHVPAEARV